MGLSLRYKILAYVSNKTLVKGRVDDIYDERPAQPYSVSFI